MSTHDHDHDHHDHDRHDQQPGAAQAKATRVLGHGIHTDEEDPHHHHHHHGDDDHHHNPDDEFCPVVGGTPIDVAAVRAWFPVFKLNPSLIPFNNAATTQVPGSVTHVVEHFLENGTASPGRGAFDQVSTTIGAGIEEARARVAAFIGANPDDIAFTSGATASLNLVALAWGLTNLTDGDEIMVCLEDHKSTVLPWFNLQQILAAFGVQIKIVPFDLHQMGNYELQSIEKAKTERTRLIAMTHVHHVYGLNMEVNEVRRILGDDVLISLDAAQSVGHRPVNLSKLPVDFLSFSGHKMFALSGVGVLWVSPRVREVLHAPFVGGGMQPHGNLEQFTLPRARVADLLEAGTPNIPAILSMVPAIEFIEDVGIDIIGGRIKELMKYLYLALRKLPGIEFSPGLDHCWHQSHGILSFRFLSAGTSDVAFVLADANILVRAGDHCIYQKQPGDDYLRVSLHVYNTEAEIDRFIEVLQSALA